MLTNQPLKSPKKSEIAKANNPRAPKISGRTLPLSASTLAENQPPLTLSRTVATIQRRDDTSNRLAREPVREFFTLQRATNQPAEFAQVPEVLRSPAVNARAYTVGHQVVQPSGNHLQMKLAVGAAGDVYEQEAERVAEGVVRMAQPSEREVTHPTLAIRSVMKTNGSNAQRFSGCQNQIIIEEARRAAAIRCQLAAFQTKGIVPPGPTGRPDPGEGTRRRAQRIARTIFGEDLNMEQVGNIVSGMGSRLASPTLTFTCAPTNDPNCSNRAAYVIGRHAPVYLCPAFFSDSDEERIRTMVHEAAHLSGIGEALGESYCPIFDCQTTCGGFNVADSWSHYVHCVSNQTPDELETTGNNTP